MRNENRTWFSRGLRDGLPIALGYLAVSFTLGIAAKNAGLSPFQAMLASLTNNASAGEFAGFTLISAGAGYLEVALMVFIANARYLLMSCALSQKLPQKTPLRHRLLIATDIADEIFGVSMAVPGKLNPFYTYGINCRSVLGHRHLFGRFDGQSASSEYRSRPQCRPLRDVSGRYRSSGQRK